GGKEQRDKYIERIDVLEKVKELNTLAGTEYMTTNRVAEFYEVPISTIRNIYYDHKSEFREDGIKSLKANEISELICPSDYPTSKQRGFVLIDNEKLANTPNNLFPKRAVLRIGMLLRDSEVAKEIRTLLLNVYHDA